MSQEKSTAVVVRLVDWSESSRVVTLFTRDFGKIGVVAKGAKRLRSAFEAGLDLLSECRIVFLRKSSSGLDILTESQLLSRFSPAAGSLSSLYGGYYLAELLNGLTEEYDPHPVLYDVCVETLARLSSDVDPRLALARFELVLLREMGLLPEFDACLVCDRPLTEGTDFSYWVSQGGLICAACRKPEYAHQPIQIGTIDVLKQLAADQPSSLPRSPIGSRLNEHGLRRNEDESRRNEDVTADQLRQIRQITVAAICHSLERRPATLRYLNLD